MTDKKILVDLDFQNSTTGKNIPTPVAPGDAVPKSYVDGLLSSFAANVGDGVATAVAVVHGLNSLDVMTEVFTNLAPFDSVLCGIERTDVNTVTLSFKVAPAVDAYRVVIKK